MTVYKYELKYETEIELGKRINVNGEYIKVTQILKANDYYVWFTGIDESDLD